MYCVLPKWYYLYINKQGQNMKFTKKSNGVYEFKGIDSWNGKEISGEISYQPFDVKISQVWQVRFYPFTHDTCAEFFGPSLKSCKNWLTK